jgi:hypothetical protein
MLDDAASDNARGGGRQVARGQVGNTLTRLPTGHTIAQREAMDFIEQIFGIAPDGGSGSLELLLLAVPLAGLAILGLVRRAQRQRRM